MPRDSGDIPKSNPLRRKVWNSWVNDRSLTRDESFVEATGEVGDVYILHPFMLHSASKNLRRDIRIITNPPVSLKEPFKYDGKNPSLVEQKVRDSYPKNEGEALTDVPDFAGPRCREPDRLEDHFSSGPHYS